MIEKHPLAVTKKIESNTFLVIREQDNVDYPFELEIKRFDKSMTISLSARDLKELANHFLALIS